MPVAFREAAGIALVGALLGLLPAVGDDARRALLAGGAPGPGAAGVACEGLAVRPEWIGQEEALRLHGRDHVVFVDARPAGDYAVGRVAGAVSLPWFDDIEVPAALVDQFRGCKTVVAYCDRHGCGDSERLAEHLLSLGVSQVRVLEGGWPDWYAGGRPVDLGGPP